MDSRLGANDHFDKVLKNISEWYDSVAKQTQLKDLRDLEKLIMAQDSLSQNDLEKSTKENNNSNDKVHQFFNSPSVKGPNPFIKKFSNNSFDEYNEKLTEVEDGSTEASPDEIGVSFQRPPDVAKDVKTKSRKHSRAEDVIVNAGSSESELSVEETTLERQKK
ncbi:hypothetical protein C1645_827294 [Glomus cerebriforme]|uniref:Uncharacterized protein n=1 Tax=Glomus cerebriforme TaxID=658196 RepID=A0A397SPZ2_9GLOM|nr:hypothetical protein C1645_827294 [Glomus cerebriforme]